MRLLSIPCRNVLGRKQVYGFKVPQEVHQVTTIIPLTYDQWVAKVGAKLVQSGRLWRYEYECETPLPWSRRLDDAVDKLKARWALYRVNELSKSKGSK